MGDVSFKVRLFILSIANLLTILPAAQLIAPIPHSSPLTNVVAGFSHYAVFSPHDRLPSPSRQRRVFRVPNGSSPPS